MDIVHFSASQEAGVYFLSPVGRDRVKIGFTVHLSERKAQIERTIGESLDVLRFISSAGQRTEANAHQAFAECRISSEWFAMKPPLSTILEETGRLDDPNRALAEFLKSPQIEKASFLNPSEAAKIVGVHQETIRNWVKSGRIEGHRVFLGQERYEYRIPKTALAELERISASDEEAEGAITTRGTQESDLCLLLREQLAHERNRADRLEYELLEALKDQLFHSRSRES